VATATQLVTQIGSYRRQVGGNLRHSRLGRLRHVISHRSLAGVKYSDSGELFPAEAQCCQHETRGDTVEYCQGHAEPTWRPLNRPEPKDQLSRSDKDVLEQDDGRDRVVKVCNGCGEMTQEKNRECDTQQNRIMQERKEQYRFEKWMTAWGGKWIQYSA
jgi:hypothetical protein